MVLKFFKLCLWICTAPLLMVFVITWILVFGGLAALLFCIAIGLLVASLASIVGFLIYMPLAQMVMETLGDSGLLDILSPEWAFSWWQEKYNEILYYNPEGFLY